MAGETKKSTKTQRRGKDLVCGWWREDSGKKGLISHKGEPKVSFKASDKHRKW